MLSSCINNIYSIAHLCIDADRRSVELFRGLNNESKNRMKLLKIYTERVRYLQNEELGLKKTDFKAELGPEQFHFKVVDELYI